MRAILDAASAKAWVRLKPQQMARAQSLNSGPRSPRKPSAFKPRKEFRAASLSRQDDLKAGVVTPKEHLSSLLDADSAKAWVRLKPARARSQYGAAPTPAPRKPSASKPRKPASCTFSHSRLDDLQAEAEVKPEELLRSLCLGRGSTKSSVILKKEKTRSLAGPRIPAAVQPRRARARSLSMPRIDAKRVDIVRPADLLRTLCLGDEMGKARITRKWQQVDAATKPLADAGSRATEGTPTLQPPPKPFRCTS
ncbi:uncharacterized protein LOC144928055 [Branchiostoma floridae x Branchiostoma belcheri]